MAGESQLWIQGEWVEASRLVPLENPYTGEVIAQVGYASVDQAKAAIESARRTFEDFRHVPAWERAHILRSVAELIADRAGELAETIARESGKPLKAARGEVERTVQTYLFAAEAARDIRGESVPMDAAPHGERHTAYTVHQPMGVVTAITPFNFPMNLVAHKVGPAIAAGNTIVLKPAEHTPLSALVLAKLFKDAGLPDGVLNIIPGDGKELSEVLTTHPDVAFVTFTGSPRVGKLIRAQAGLRKVTLELGSNSPMLVDAGFDEGELNKIADETAAGAFSYNGQVCISIQRIYVHRSLYDRFTAMVAERAQRLKIGNPLDEDTDISALINQEAVDRLSSWVKNAVDTGAKVVTGDKIDGRVMHPTVLTDVPENAELSQEEAFGPVVLIAPFDDWRDAIRRANNSKFGLNAGAFTKNIDHALLATQELHTGAVLINQVPTFRVDQMPYGGVKESGTGREGVRYAMYDMMDVKMVAFRSGAFS
ncbi:aldehyde dehydrogenase family protein [Alicyclobacillus fastidiosus]|uniref:Aldehyde dehydrogenase family protein n=1 Tax=Alicyclobacillus fastidiosus TaxID=392011 RepID=A0ABY6ZEJ0_9BACL|nr:aldehyde dehydrogenase family protein [Alicyclobacillus fastidiosus]WAH40968.1 aldehyde dehydrogenase family protein [Alicyclobacillus fastidiosus]GMA62482.1 aldehyde dehydrogenase [Alicyclobacillus fastidiosus]